ncbi:MAG: DUF4403 family protein [Deltaproteobacteria bacterium]|nr:DUF4403 family protein [Deltaproteobacteria bacterium]
MRTHPALFALPLLLGCAHRLQIPQPPTAGPGAVLPPLPAASIDLPLRADIRGTLRSLESLVPEVFDTNGRFQMIGPTPVGVRYRVQRAPFRFEPTGGGIHVEATLAITAEACVGAPMGLPIPFMPSCQVVASCGVNEAPRQVTVSADTTIRLDPSWHIFAQTVPAAPVFRDRCELTMFHVDVTEFVATYVAQQVAAATQRMDATVNANGDLSPRAQELWSNLNTPMDLGDGFWLTLSPQRVFAAPFELTTESASTRVGILRPARGHLGPPPYPIALAPSGARAQRPGVAERSLRADPRREGELRGDHGPGRPGVSRPGDGAGGPPRPGARGARPGQRRRAALRARHHLPRRPLRRNPRDPLPRRAARLRRRARGVGRA